MGGKRHTKEDEFQKYKVAEVIMHPKWSRSTGMFDIVLFRVSLGGGGGFQGIFF